MVQAQSFQSAVQARDPRRVRSRNLRTGLLLVGTFLALFVGSIIFVLLNPPVK